MSSCYRYCNHDLTYSVLLFYKRLLINRIRGRRTTRRRRVVLFVNVKRTTRRTQRMERSARHAAQSSCAARHTHHLISQSTSLYIRARRKTQDAGRRTQHAARSTQHAARITQTQACSQASHEIYKIIERGGKQTRMRRNIHYFLRKETDWREALSAGAVGNGVEEDRACRSMSFNS